MRFCTAINCIDGRVQLPVIKFLRRRARVPWVDVVSGPGPVRVLAEDKDAAAIDSIVRGVRASIHHHESRLVAVVAHHDCAANPVEPPGQLEQLTRALAFVKRRFPETQVVGLWVDARSRVTVPTAP